MPDDLGLMFGQTHSELVRRAIELLHIEAPEAAAVAGDAGREEPPRPPGPAPAWRGGAAGA